MLDVQEPGLDAILDGGDLLASLACPDPMAEPVALDMGEPTSVAQWNRAADILRPRIGRLDGSHTINDVLAYTLSGRIAMWLGRHTVIFTEIELSGSTSLANVFFAAGDLDEIANWSRRGGPLDQWAASKGVGLVGYCGRVGFSRSVEGFSVIAERHSITRRDVSGIKVDPCSNEVSPFGALDQGFIKFWQEHQKEIDDSLRLIRPMSQDDVFALLSDDREETTLFKSNTFAALGVRIQYPRNSDVLFTKICGSDEDFFRWVRPGGPVERALFDESDDAQRIVIGIASGGRVPGYQRHSEFCLRAIEER